MLRPRILSVMQQPLLTGFSPCICLQTIRPGQPPALLLDMEKFAAVNGIVPDSPNHVGVCWISFISTCNTDDG